ncbi:response regulator [Companilactobacillus futsaii]|jgi:two-component system response regulator AgrA|uniref:Response regulator transcription factor n=2 Tax=Companilactobacillus futsaii TaxID=938155 RepID=A0A5B7T0V1_9LACO|nr:response regulator [Companilactobacillus futsaii]KRK96852.1 response regulator [Companilactobacillus futsaii JCM 17355]QCX25667.1 response regulator transcription factor [Companilactobacillus futsaii]
MSYPIIICEDNPIQLKKITTLVENYLLFHANFFNLSLAVQTPEEVLKYLKTSNSNNGVYILDIDLKSNIDGIDLASEIRSRDINGNIIFTTTHEEMAPTTLKRKVAAVGFIEKDQTVENYRDELYGTLEYIKKLIESSKEYPKQNFIFEIGNQIFNFDQSEVFSVESSPIPHQLVFSSKHGQYEFYGKLNALESKYSFLFRLNRSCLINPMNIQQVNFHSRDVLLKNGVTKKFSIGKATKLKHALLNL